MQITESDQLSEAKKASGHEIIGHQKEGGIIWIDGLPHALKHNMHRFNGDTEVAWGRPDSGYTLKDAPEIKLALFPIPEAPVSVRVAQQWLLQLRNGEMPLRATIGAEVEGGKYSSDGKSLISAYPNGDATRAEHPELLEATIETATSCLPNGRYPNDPVEIAQLLALAVVEADSIAQEDGGIVSFSSLYEVGDPRSIRLTPHGYLQSFAPKVLKQTIADAANIPLEVRRMYAAIGIPDIVQYLSTSGVLNWPTHALHVHNGIPQIENGLADPRSALAMGAIRLTEFAKLVALTMGNTRHVYGVDMGYHGDARAVMRRLLATSRDQTVPLDAYNYFAQATQQLTTGAIHSLDRYPATGQHGVLRQRIGGTVESIDAPMNPDLRTDLMWIYFNQIMNIIGLDALVEVGGVEKNVLPYLQQRWGNVFSVLPAMGMHSSYSFDCAFNKDGLMAQIPSRDSNVRKLIAQIIPVLDYYSNKYPAIWLQARIVAAHLMRALSTPIPGADLADYMGVGQSHYESNGMQMGIVTDYKQDIPINKLLVTQARGSQLQAQALLQVRDNKDLEAFFAI